MKLEQRFIEGEGPLDCKMAFIGEAPGVQEASMNRNFIGPAGYLFDRLLMMAGIIRAHCYITNTVKRKPYGNNITQFLDLGKKYPIETDEFKEHVSYLKEELSQCKANVIVAVGGTALWALCGLKLITKRRGSIIPSTLLPGRKVIPILHPSGILQGGGFTYKDPVTNTTRTAGPGVGKVVTAFDLKRARKHSEFPEIPPDDFELITDPDIYEVIALLSDIKDEVTLDIEVVNEEVSAINIAETNKAGYCIVLKDFTIEEEAEIWRKIARISEDPSIEKIGQFYIFDTTFFFRKYGIRSVNMHDTMIMQGIVNADFPKGLGFINSLCTEIPYYKDDLKRVNEGEAGDDTFRLYSARDAISTKLCKDELYENIIQTGNKDYYESRRRLIEPLIYMSEKGTRLDLDGMKIESVKAGEKIEELKEELNQIVGYDINPNSHIQVKEYFYEKKRITPYKSRAKGSKGKPTVNEKALVGIKNKGYREASLILNIRKRIKSKSNYLDVTPSIDGRLKCVYNPVGGDGRLSSSTNIFGEGTNTQNWPHPMLRYLLADENYIIYNADLKQADTRVVAYIAPEPIMIKLFEDNKDIHAHTAGGIFDKDPADVTRESGECPICADPDLCGHEGERYWGKKSGHSFNYLLGYKQFAYLMEIPERDAKHIRIGYLRLYPGLSTMWNWQRAALSDSHILTDCYGWSRRFVNDWGPELFKQAASFIPRATVGEKINRDGILNIWNDSSLSKVELLNQVHDSIVFQIPIKAGWTYHEKAVKKIKQYLETPVVWKGHEFIIPAGVSMGLNLYRYNKDDNKTGMIELIDITKNNIRSNYEQLQNKNRTG